MADVDTDKLRVALRHARAAEALMAGLVLRFLPLSAEERTAVEALAQPAFKNWNGIEVGQIRVSPEVRGAD